MVTEVLNSLIGNQLAAAVLSIAKDNGLDISAESYSVGPALHFSGRDAPTYEMLLEHMFPKREVKLDDFPEFENLTKGKMHEHESILCVSLQGKRDL